MHGRGPSNLNQLVSLFAPLMFAELHNHFLLLTISLKILSVTEELYRGTVFQNISMILVILDNLGKI